MQNSLMIPISPESRPKGFWLTVFVIWALIVAVLILVSKNQRLTYEIKEIGSASTTQDSYASVNYCENVIARVKVTSVGTTTGEFIQGKAIVIEPATESGKETTFSVNKPVAVGQTMKLCNNLIVE